MFDLAYFMLCFSYATQQVVSKCIIEISKRKEKENLVIEYQSRAKNMYVN
jgi:hypothetical protein